MQSNAMQIKAKQCNFESNAEQCIAMQSNANQCNTMQSNAKFLSCNAMQCKVKMQSKAMQSNAKQCNAKQCKATSKFKLVKAKQCKAMQSNHYAAMKAMLCNAKQCKAVEFQSELQAMQSNVQQCILCKAMQSNVIGKWCKLMLFESNAKQCQAMQHNAITMYLKKEHLIGVVLGSVWFFMFSCSGLLTPFPLMVHWLVVHPQYLTQPKNFGYAQNSGFPMTSIWYLVLGHLCLIYHNLMLGWDGV